MTRRTLFTLATAPLLVPGVNPGTPAALPLVTPEECLSLCLNADTLLSVREEADLWLRMQVGEVHDWPLNVAIHGKHAQTRAELLAELKRLVRLLESSVPLTDDWGHAVKAELLPGTARLLGWEFWK